MKTSILSAATLLASVATADLTVAFYGGQSCEPIHRFNLAFVPPNGSCFKFPQSIHAAESIDLEDCQGRSDCLCTVFASDNCDIAGSWAQVAFFDGQTANCPVTEGFVFGSAICNFESSPIQIDPPFH